MHQDIKNFSQIMDINHNLILSYKLVLHKTPDYKFTINGQEILDIEGSVMINQDQDIVVRCYKNNDNSAVEIESLVVNGREILKKYLHLANPPTHWIENCQEWELKIPKHFYAWYQEITGNGEIF